MFALFSILLYYEEFLILHTISFLNDIIFLNKKIIITQYFNK